MRANVKLILGGSVVAFALAGIKYWPRESLEVAGSNLIDAVFERNAARVVQYVGPRELEVSGLSQAQMQELLDEFVLPKLTGYRRVGRPYSSPDGLSHHLIVQQDLVNSNGRQLSLAFDMLRSPDGPKSDETCFHLISLACHAIGPDRRDLRGLERARASLEIWDQVLPDLERLSMKGYALMTEVGQPLRFTTWQETRQRKFDMLQRLLADESPNHGLIK